MSDVLVGSAVVLALGQVSARERGLVVFVAVQLLAAAAAAEKMRKTFGHFKFGIVFDQAQTFGLFAQVLSSRLDVFQLFQKKLGLVIQLGVVQRSHVTSGGRIVP